MTEENVLERKTPPQRSGSGQEDEIMYVPGPQDPVETTVAGDGSPRSGIKFRANIPQKISRKVTTTVLVRAERENADGQIVSRAIEKRVPLVDLLRDNPCFSINGAPPRIREQGMARLPSDPDSYRGYAYGWIAAAKDAQDLKIRWDAEEETRNRLGVTTEDLRQLVPFYQGRLISLGGAREIEALPPQ
jgi:hypothetical protein